ncbi:MAG: hypothetical protein Q9162_001374 [Coniocarpon cinnabarinum]
MEQFGQEIAKAYQVKCLDKPQPFVGQPPRDPVQVFMEYPALTGWRRSKDGQWHNDAIEGQLRSPDAHTDGGKFTERISAMIQRWLFFEVLHAFFHIDDVEFNYNDYITWSNDKHFITTEKLGCHLDRWKKQLSGPSAKDRNRRILQAYDILIKARDDVSQYCATRGTAHTRASIWPVDPTIALSIIALGETLTSYLLSLHADQEIEIGEVGWRHRILATQSWGFSGLVLEELKEKWKLEDAEACPRLDNILKMFRGNTVALLLANQDDPKYSDHGLCEPHVCKAKSFSQLEAKNSASVKAGDWDQVTSAKEYKELKKNDPKPQPEHHNAKKKGGRTCRCQRHATVKGRSIAASVLEIIDSSSNKRPLFSRDSSGQLVIHAAEKDEPFTVFSHSWADGFGNDQNTNFIFDCNLKLLDDMCRKGKPSEPYDLTNHGPLFWIDALGIPVGPGYEESRIRAIKQIHETYAAATEAIVLDEGLLYRPAPSDPVVQAMRISMSSWIERIWTLQEAFLSKRLTFMFGEGLVRVDADELRNSLSKSVVPAKACICAVADKFYARILRDKREEHFRRKDGPQQHQGVTASFVASAYEAVQYRNASDLKDETEALAVMFNLQNFFENDNDQSPRRGDPPEKWMQWLVRKLLDAEAIPAALLFLDGEKLSTPGFRWAPKRWLNPQPTLTPNPLAVATGSSKRGADGLVVKLPGMDLKFLSDQNASFAEADCIRAMSLSRVDEMYTIRSADKDVPLPTGEAIGKRGLAIITLEENVVQPETIALLVAINRRAKSTSFVQILNRVWLSREHDVGKVQSFKDRLHQRERHFHGRRSSAVHMLHLDVPSTREWCVEGRDVPTASDTSTHGPEDPFDYQPRPGITASQTWGRLTRRVTSHRLFRTATGPPNEEDGRFLSRLRRAFT